MRQLTAPLCVAGLAAALLPATAIAAPVTTRSLISLAGVGGIGISARA